MELKGEEDLLLRSLGTESIFNELYCRTRRPRGYQAVGTLSLKGSGGVVYGLGNVRS